MRRRFFYISLLMGANRKFITFASSSVLVSTCKPILPPLKRIVS